MYNGIGLTTARGSGTNGFVIRNLSAVRKTKEKVREYKEKEDAAVRPFDVELIEHERRRQAEVRCLELQELLEEQNIPEDEINEKVNAFRAKLLAEKKSGPRDASGRPILRDSHELAMAQEEKNEKAKNAFGISDDFVPGSSYDRAKPEKEKSSLNSVPTLEAAKKESRSNVGDTKGDKEKLKKKKKSHKRRASSSSSGSSSSEEESRRKKRKKEKKKKSKKSHSHHHHKRKNRSPSHETIDKSLECACVASLSPSSTHSCFNHNSSSEDSSQMSTEIQLSGSSCVAIVDLASSTSRRDSCQSKSKSPIEIISLPCKFAEDKPSICHVQSSSSSAHSKFNTTNMSPITTTATIVLNDLRSSDFAKAGGIYDFSRSNSRSGSTTSRESYSRSRSSTRSRSVSPASITHRLPTSPSSSSSRSRSRSRSVRSFSRSSESHSDRSRSRSGSNSYRNTHARDRSASVDSGKSNHRCRSRSHSKSRSPSASSKSSRSLSIPRRRGSPSFLDRRRITSARKRPIPYKRRQGSEWENSSDSSDSSD